MTQRPITLHTAATHRPVDMPSRVRAMEATAYTAALQSLRRVGAESVDWGRQSGTRLDSRTLAARAALPAARVFGARSTGDAEQPAVGLLLIVDASGSMRCGFGEWVEGATRATRAEAALSVAAGIARACDALGVPVTLASHDESGGRLRVIGWGSTRAALGAAYDAQPMMSKQGAGNYDAPAVSHSLRAFAPLARRRAVVLVCDGEPAISDHTARAARTLAEIRREGAALAVAGIMSRESVAHGLARDWGAARCASAESARDLARVIVRALAEARG